jgi:hypothetical protein
LSAPSEGTVIGHSQGVGTILDSTALPQQVFAGDVVVYEGDTGQPAVAKVPISLAHAATTQISVMYSVVPAGADGSDYTVKRPTGVLKFNSGARVKYVSVSIPPDLASDDSDFVQIDGSSTAVPVARGGTLTIAHDD